MLNSYYKKPLNNATQEEVICKKKKKILNHYALLLSDQTKQLQYNNTKVDLALLKYSIFGYHYFAHNSIIRFSIIHEFYMIYISRHTIVCHAAQEAGVPHRGYIDRKKENIIFTPLYLSDPLSDWNQICYSVARQPWESTFHI